MAAMRRKNAADITKMPIRERLIHLLALRPYKKLELYSRLSKEGLKVKDRSSLLTVLKDISKFSRNCYELRQHAWKDVNDNWTFYSDEDKAILKTRKSQILTPPINSDGGSLVTAQNLTSTDPVSHPVIISSTMKRQLSDIDENNGVRPKKQRIAHQKNPFRPDIGCNKLSGNAYRKPISEENRGGYTSNNANGSSVNGKVMTDHDGQIKPIITTYERQSDNRLSFNVARDKSIDNTVHRNGDARKVFSGYQSNNQENPNTKTINDQQNRNTKLNKFASNTETIRSVIPSVISNNQQNLTERLPEDAIRDQLVDRNASKYTDNIDESKPIIYIDHRKRYSKDAVALYEEHISLYNSITNVFAIYTDLQKQLEFTNQNPLYMEIINKIIEEVNLRILDPQPSKDRQRFEYLYGKLSHIKKLVTDFD